MRSLEEIELVQKDDDNITPSQNLSKLAPRQDTEEEYKFIHLNGLQIEKYIRLSFNCAFIGGSMIIMYFERDNSPYHNISLCMALVQILWSLQFIGILMTIKHLHSIVVFRKIVENTLFLVVPYKFKEYEQQIMASTSTMSSLRGSNVFHMLGTSANISFGMTFSAAMFKFFDYRTYDILHQDIVSLDILVISVFGFGIISTWEFDHHSKLSQMLHYFGGFVWFIMAPLAFAMYQDFSILGIILMVITYSCYIGFHSIIYAWNHNLGICGNMNDGKPENVHKMSLLCITLELIAVCCVMTNVVLYIWCMEGNTVL